MRRQLQRLVAGILFIEQPITRAHALDGDVSALSSVKPVIIDESDDGLDVFPRARSLGYTGVSSKCCKGLYKSIFNAARCARWNAEAGAPRYFMTGEDLTTQAGLAVQQDLALVNLLGIRHVRAQRTPLCQRHGGLARPSKPGFWPRIPTSMSDQFGAARLRISRRPARHPVARPAGFASGAYPDWEGLKAMD